MALTTLLAAGPSASQPQTAMREALRGYLRGDPDAFGRHLARVRAATALADFSRAADTWLRAAPPGERVATRRAVAVASLDLAHHALTNAGWGDLEVPRLWEFASRRIARADGPEFELLWFRAAVAVSSASGGRAWLGARVPGFGPTAAFSLIDETRKRFSGDPRFDLAELLARRAVRTAANRPADDIAQLAGVPNLAGSGARAAVMGTLRALDRLKAHASISGEVHLRAGMVRFHLGLIDEALQDARTATSSDDTLVAHLGYVLAGHCLDASGRSDEALESYQRAVALVPRARSGLVPLASQLVRADRHEEAYDAAARALRPAPASEDPWILYGWGDYRFWPDYRRRLRLLVRP